MKTKNLVTLVVVTLVVVLLSVVCLTGVQIGKYIVIPAADGIARGAEFKGSTSIVLNVNELAAEHDHSDDETEEDHADEHIDTPASPELVDDTIAVMQRRTQMLTMHNVTVVKQGSSRVRIDIPTTDVNAASGVLYTITDTCDLSIENADGDVLAKNENIASCQLGMDQNQTIYLVAIKFDEETLAAWNEKTAADDILTVYLDGTEICATTSAQILGSGMPFNNYEQALNAFMAMRTGRIQTHLHQAYYGVVPAQLSSEQFDNGITAVCIATLVAAIAMLVVYKMKGFVSAVSLVLCTVATIFFFGGIPYMPFGVASFFAMAAAIGVKVFCDKHLIESVNASLAEGLAGKEAVAFAGRASGLRALEICGVAIVSALIMQYFGAESVSAFTVVFAAGCTIALLVTAIITKPLISCVVQKAAKEIR